MNALLRNSDRPSAATPPILPAISSALEGSPFQFVIRCVLEGRGDFWQAFSLELGLAVQAETKAEAKRKLKMMIRCYIDDAVCGQDRRYAYELLSRKATWRVYLLYYLASAIKAVRGAKGYTTFSESLPLIPQPC
jgi:hypothetical protein